MTYTQNVISRFSENSNPENIKPMSDYMKGKFEYFGIKTPQRREISKEIFTEFGLPDEENFVTIVKELWSEPQRELHYFALDLINKIQKKLSGNYLEVWEYLIITNSWWDSVDGIASNIIGDHFVKYKSDKIPVTRKWMDSGNIWLQRSALLFQLKYKKATDVEILDTYIRELASSKEFFIQKAIGWILREYSKSNPDWVRQFVMKIKLASLSYREATKYV